MKKLLILLAFIAVGISSQAQLIPFRKTGTTATYSTSFTNTAADTLDVTLNKIPSLVTVKSVITRSSGTMGGKVYLYYATDPARAYVLCDSATLSNAATNTTYFTKAVAAPYWRLIRNGATTVTGTSAARISVAQ
jgi:hypothetical protein